MFCGVSVAGTELANILHAKLDYLLSSAVVPLERFPGSYKRAFT
jgi:hypothetical protein